MLIGFYLLYLCTMPIVTRSHGSGYIEGWYPRYSKLASKILLSCTFALSAWLWTHNPYYTFAATAFSLMSFSTGHGRFFAMRGVKLNSEAKPELIEKLFGWAYRGSIHKPAYSIYCMMIKGLGIATLSMPYAFLFAPIYTACYYFSFKYTNDSIYSEYAIGFFLGLIALIGWVL